MSALKNAADWSVAASLSDDAMGLRTTAAGTKQASKHCKLTWAGLNQIFTFKVDIF
jgi:hypothetical protein